MAFTRDWEESIPVGTEDASLGDNRIRNLKVELGERLEDLLCGFNISDGTGDESTAGVKKLNFKEQSSISTPSANQITLAAKEGSDGDAKAQIFGKDEEGNERQFTKTSGSGLRLNVKAGDYAADSIDEDDIRLANNSYLTARNQTGDGDINLIKVNASNVPEVLVGAVLSADTAPASDPAVANKKYVDAQVAAATPDEDAFGTWANLDSASATLVKNEVYKVGSDGFVVLYQTDGAAGETTMIKTDGSNPPTTIRVHRQSAYLIGMTCPVKKDNYWKVQVTGSGNPTISWLPIGTGTCVKQ